MKISSKSRNLFWLLTLGPLFIANHAGAQKLPGDYLNRYLGTWFGIVAQPFDETKKKELVYLTWRIHRIDAAKNQIYITQIGKRFDDGSSIANPKKIIYTFTSDRTGLAIHVEGYRPNRGYDLHLSSYQVRDSVVIVKAFFKKNDDKKEGKPFDFTKISDDTTPYIKPKGEIQVIIAPPPQP